jgi:F0F1-type ATP synthase epsilon subunit
MTGDLRLTVVTPRGVVVEQAGLDEVVLRRRETDHDPGSEVVILRRHGPLLMQTPACQVRYRRGARERRVQVGPGTAEVLDDWVTVLAQSAERV